METEGESAGGSCWLSRTISQCSGTHRPKAAEVESGTGITLCGFPYVAAIL